MRFAIYYFFNQADATTFVGDPSDPAGWYDSGANPLSLNLVNGKTVFIKNHFSGGPITVTSTGQVFQGTNVSVINPGYNLIGLQVPISTNVVAGADGTPLPYGLPTTLTSQSAVNPTHTLNDSLLYWTGSAYAISIISSISLMPLPLWVTRAILLVSMIRVPIRCLFTRRLIKVSSCSTMAQRLTGRTYSLFNNI